MAIFGLMFLDIIKIQLRWFQIEIAASRVYPKCQLGGRPPAKVNW